MIRDSARNWPVIGSAVGAAIGGATGLVVGLAAHPATAWFAVFELGVPSAVLGCAIGLVAMLLQTAFEWASRRR